MALRGNRKNGMVQEIIKTTWNIHFAMLQIAVLVHPHQYLMIQRKETVTNANCP